MCVVPELATDQALHDVLEMIESSGILDQQQQEDDEEEEQDDEEGEEDEVRL